MRVRWEYPGGAHGTPGFILNALDAIESWTEIYAYRRSDTWHCTDENEPEGQMCSFIFRAVGVPAVDSAVFVFSKSDIDALATLVLATLCFGWCVYDDLFLVPDHGRQILYFDHHDVVHVSFKDQEGYDRFRAELGPEANQVAGN
jgi:hypothetical protein